MYAFNTYVYIEPPKRNLKRTDLKTPTKADTYWNAVFVQACKWVDMYTFAHLRPCSHCHHNSRARALKMNKFSNENPYTNINRFRWTGWNTIALNQMVTEPWHDMTVIYLSLQSLYILLGQKWEYLVSLILFSNQKSRFEIYHTEKPLFQQSCNCTVQNSMCMINTLSCHLWETQLLHILAWWRGVVLVLQRDVEAVYFVLEGLLLWGLL